MNVLNINRAYATGVLTLLLLTVMVCIPRLSNAEITASAALNSAQFSVDDMARLTITVNGARSADLEIPDTDKFTIHQRGKSSQINMINGSFSSSITITCTIQPYEAGNHTIPAITIHAGGTSLQTEPIPFTVTTGSAPPASGTAAAPSQGNSYDSVAFVTLEHAKSKSYIGQIIPVEIKAYFRQGLRANLNSTPTIIGDGIIMPQLNDQPQQTRERVGNVVYNVLSWSTTLSNIKEGTHTIRLELDATQLIPQRRNSSMFHNRSPFDDDLFDSFFGGGYKEKRMKVKSEEITLEILPLPDDGKPDNFTGAIGRFTLKTEAEPLQAEVGEPLTLSMMVQGTGNFDRVEAPQFPAGSDWKTYTPSSEFIPAGTNTLQGTKHFEQAIVAKTSDITVIPPVSFSYFDPEKGSYQTVESPPIPVTISGKTVAQPVIVQQTPAVPKPVEQPQNNEAKAPLISGLAPIHLDAGTPVVTLKPLYQRAIIIVPTMVSLLVMVIMIVLRIIQARTNAHPEKQRHKERSSMLQQGLVNIDNAAAKEDSVLFLAECRSTIQNYLGAQWNCEPTAITSANLTRQLPESSTLVTIFTIAEQAAYSGIRLDRATMEQYARQLRAELEEMI